MFVSYLKVAYRYLLRHKSYTLINVLGLAVGMAACVLILLYVQDELRYDTSYPRAGRIVRITQEDFGEDGATTARDVMLDPPIAPLLEQDFPEVQLAGRLTPVGPALAYGDVHVGSGDCFWADPSVLRILGIRLAEGDAETALDEPFSLVLSRSKAHALFGDDEPLGKTVVVNDDQGFTVTGIFDDLDTHVHLPIDVLGSLATMESWFGPLGWDSPNYLTYALLAPGTDADDLEARLGTFFERHRGADYARSARLHVQRLGNIYLHSTGLTGDYGPRGDVRYVYLFSAVALVILLIACLNFMNLSTARSTRRAKEVGMRKVSGARRSELVHQFLGESTALALLSMVLAVVLVQLALPAFNTFTGKTLVLLGGDVWRDVLVLVGIGLVVGVVAGAYPAFVLSAFRPAVVIKGRLAMKRRTWSLRSLMVVVQFTIAMVLMVGTLVIYRQLAYVRTERLGFDKEHVLILPTIWDLRSDFEPLRERLLQNPDVVDVAQSNPIPSRRLSWTRTLTSHDARTGGEHALTGYQVVIDAHFFPTYRIPFVAGRNLTTIHTSDDRLGVVLNERAARLLGWADAADAINQPLDLDGQTRADIVGVVQDFHFESFHQAIVPMVFVIDPPNNRQVSVRIRPNSDIPGVIAFLERQWQRYDPDEPLNYSFLDQRFDDVYRAEQRLGRVFGVFAFLAIAITCLGLFGMATFSVEQRTKEIGVRRVMGARVGQLVLLLSREFTVLVGIAFVVAVPAAYYAMARWLDGFAYHVPLSWWMFAVVGVVAMAVALATVSTQSIKAATANPAKVLRYE